MGNSRKFGNFKSLYLINFPIKIFLKLDRKQKKGLLSLLSLMILTSIFESFSLFSIIPLLSLFSDEKNSFEGKWYYHLFKNLNLNQDSFLNFFFIFALLVLLTTCARLFTIYYSTSFSAKIGSYLSVKVFSKILYDNFQNHIKRSSSEVINTLERKSKVTALSINSFLQMITAIILIIFIVSTLLLVDWKFTLILFTLFTLIYILIASIFNNKITKNGKIASEANQRQIKAAQDGIGSLRNVILNNTYNFFIKKFSLIDFVMRNKEAENLFLNMAPRYLVEGLSLTLISMSIIVLKNYRDVSYIIPLIGAFALGSQRLLPLLQQIYSSYAGLIAWKSDVNSMLFFLYKDIDIKKKNVLPLNFQEKIELKNVSFYYEDSSNKNLKNINLTIKKGDRVGIIGKTGSGKTTLADVISGLLLPNEGKLFVDGREQDIENISSYQKIISYIPQNTFLIEGTITDNIAFGIDNKNIDYKKLKKSAKYASIFEFINSLPKGFDTYIGERGVNLSGGQGQRVAIARAFYLSSSIFILDESTSSLDMTTELEVTNSLRKIKKDITLIIIAHRPSTLNVCNKIIKMSNGEIIEIKKK